MKNDKKKIMRIYNRYNNYDNDIKIMFAIALILDLDVEKDYTVLCYLLKKHKKHQLRLVSDDLSQKFYEFCNLSI